MAEYIERESLVSWLKEAGAFLKIEVDHKRVCHVVGKIIDHIEAITTADVQKVRHAKFELVQNGKGVCSNCHRLDSIDDLAKYCRYCGAYIVESATDTNVGSRKEKK